MATAATNDPMLPQPHSVREVMKETSDTFTLTLEAPSGNRFQPGQFSMLWVFGVGELPISISGDPAERDRLSTNTARSVGHATQTLVSRQVGEAVGVRGPFGTGWPVERTPGLGCVCNRGWNRFGPAPPGDLRGSDNREKYGRLVILYGARSPRDLLYRKELAAWARQRETQVLVTVDYGGLSWRGNVGVVTTLFKSMFGCSRRILWPSPADPRS